MTGERYSDVRVRELTSNGNWPWRFIVEGRTLPVFYKPWPWSKKERLRPAAWVQLRHGIRDFRPCDASDASALHAHYEKKIKDTQS